MKSRAERWFSCSLPLFPLLPPLFLPLRRPRMAAACVQLLLAASLWLTPLSEAAAVAPLNVSRAAAGTPSDLWMLSAAGTPSDLWMLSAAGSRRRRDVSSREINALLDYHNRVRSQVSPPAANMEFMLWDEGLAKSADSWASQCVWDHGPTQAMRYMGQNLSITTGRYRSITDLVRSWYEERHHFSYPNRCSGAVCSHYTQMVWASTKKVGCAVRKCSNMKVFGNTWKEATLLVCNYSMKGNWVGEVPYTRGKPCSVCPSSYGGSCWRNQCSPKTTPRRHTRL
ncbi:peptidase inhibitor R3HDML [Pseudochaenichthys georgianus]|uniref:peptidase inhibitor R3HDML n=1 Tax=Pseudochaenichthys georgianus TaxID=52239 RepID=UPI00146AF961|nr:peptidase inhibitor R3HDML [Pseudochaenichthys georgianus]